MSKKEYRDGSLSDLLGTKGFVTEPKEPKRKNKPLGRLLGACAVAGLILMVIMLIFVSMFINFSKPFAETWNKWPDRVGDVAIAEHNWLYDANGDIYADLWEENRVSLGSLDDVSPYVIDALISTEDASFYENAGFNPKGIGRAALSGEGGGSGITQQLVKNLQFYDLAGRNKEAATEATIERKLKELKMSINYEQDFSKDEILLQYLNTVSFGAPNVYSIESAARYFFNKSAKDLTLAESAALVGSVKNPAYWNLDDDASREVWRNRQYDVLGRMVAENNITREEADAAFAEDLIITRTQTSVGNCTSSVFPYYCEYVMKELRNSPKLAETQEERDAILAKGGLHIRTYLDPVEMSLMNDQLRLDFGIDNRAVAPTAIVRTGSGGVSSFGANRDYGDGAGQTTINLADSPAATGSTYKVITLAAALESGLSEQDLTFGSPCPYAPAGFDSPPGGFVNSEGCGFQNGVLNYLQATAWSSNTWYTSLAARIGMDKVYNMSRALNLNVPEGLTNRSLSFVLGAVEDTPINMAAAFATFANGGVFCPATSIIDYNYMDGTAPAIPDSFDPTVESCRRVMSPYTASVVLKALRANTYGEGVNNPFGVSGRVPNYDAVGKSGTNQSYNYAWGQVSRKYSLFTDIYDPINFSQGVVNNTRFRGGFTSSHAAQDAGPAILARITQGQVSEPLDYDNQDRTLLPVPTPIRDFFYIPSFLGMKPAEALRVAEGLDIQVHISKEKKEAPEGYQNGVIVGQSLQSGLRLPAGTQKELLLFISE